MVAAGAALWPAAARAASYGTVAFAGNFVPGTTVAERTAGYRRLRDAGVEAVRIDFTWAAIETGGRYDFRERDAEVAAIRGAGLRVIGILAYGHPDHSAAGAAAAQTPAGGGLPPFGVGSAQYFPPDDPADYARYAQAVAGHYGDEVMAWEVWNEENEGWRFWAPREDPPAYARLLCAAHDALKAADPATPVLYGGLFFPAVAGQPGMSAPDFLDATYRADPRLGRCFDVLAYHPYPYPFTAPELDVPLRGSVLSARDDMQAVLDEHGDGAMPLWITEVGWPTHDRTYGVSETKQAQYVARMEAATFAQGVPLLTWYTYGDYEDPSGANQEAAFGFFRADGSPKPAYAALRTFARVMRGARFAADRSAGRRFEVEYRRPDGTTITALWLACESASDGQGRGPDCSEPSSERVELPVGGARVRVVDHLGTARSATVRDGRLTLDAGPGPLYVITSK